VVPLDAVTKLNVVVPLSHGAGQMRSGRGMPVAWLCEASRPIQQRTNNGEPVVGFDLEEKDLAHIRIVLNHLDHPVEGARACDAGAVISLDYWRARISAILAMPRLPIHVEKLAKDLLCHVDLLAERRRGTSATRAGSRQ
jgi:hypothetical protein